MDSTSTLPPLPTGPGAPPGATTAHRRPAPLNVPSGPAPGRDRHTAPGAGRSVADRLPRVLRGPSGDPAWARPSWAALLGLTGLLYLWGLGKNGWANSFYAAAVQAGSVSWKAFFFGSSDAASSITVDKTPLSLWPMELAARVFGLNSWSLLVPQALMGIATVALVHRVVRRSTGSHAAALLAGSVLALTPVAVLMFRFDNPDAALTLLMTAAAAATLRAVEETRRPAAEGGHPVRWIALGGALVGLAFLAKMLQAFLVLPALVLVYLLLARTSWGKKLGHLLVAFGAMLLAGGWWVAIVSLLPASARPYVGGSQDNSILELALGYNGLGRLSGNETGSVGGGGAGGGGNWGATGVLRLFDGEIGGQVAWLVPAALVLGAAGLWFARRTRPVAASLVLWLTWLVVTAATFSFMAGIFHAYYTVALAPAIAVLVGTGAWVLWTRRSSLVASGLMSGTLALTAVLAWFLLDRADGFVPWLKWVVLVVGLATALVLAGVSLLPRRLALGVVGMAAVVSLAGPAAYAVDTVATAHTGSIVTAGPSTGSGGPGGVPGGRPGGTPPTGTAGTQNRFGTPPTGTQNGTTGTPTTQARTGGMGGLLNGTTPSAALQTLLTTDADSYTWVAATVGANNASGYQLATGDPVMPIGGFNGSDPSPTLAQFKAYVANGQIHYFIASGGFGGGSRGGSGTASQITAWVEANFTAKTVGGTTVYDLSSGVR